MNNQRKHIERGQVLVILMIGVVALLAFAALAIDGSMYYSDRRYDQNAADASALAGAGAAAVSMVDNGINYANFDCASSDPTIAAAMDAAMAAAVAEAQSRALANHFTILSDLSTQHGVTATCVVDTSGTYPHKFIQVDVMVSSILKTSLLHLFFDGVLRNTVEAVSIAEPSEGVGKGLAIVALDDECQGNDGGLYFDGNTEVQINFSGAHSNACVVKNGGVDVSADCGDPSDPGYDPTCIEAIHFIDSWTDNGSSGSVSPSPSPTTELIPRYNNLTVDCGPKPANPPKIQNGGDLTPGWYQSIRVSTGKTLTLDPGLYCIEGNFTGLGGTVLVDSLNINDGVTLYLVGGNFDVAGGMHVELRAARSKVGSPAAIPGMLIYLPPGNSGVIKIMGDATSNFRGSIYAPDGSIEVGGSTSSMSTLSSQFVANDVVIHGTSDLSIDLHPEDLYWGDAFMSLTQ